MGKQRTTPADPSEARTRLRTANAYLEVAELVLAGHERDEFFNVAAGLSVLAGIAASDAITARRLHEIHRGDDHRAAAQLLQQATPDGAKLATTLRRLIDVKEAAHYGVLVLSASKARESLRWAKLLVGRAQEEMDR